MNQREKLLVWVVAAMVGLLTANFGLKNLIAAFATRNEAIERISEEIRTKELHIHRGALARREMNVYEERSLPSDEARASSRYRAWLGSWLDASGLEKFAISFIGPQKHADNYTGLRFSVNCDADVVQLTRLLYDFYQADHLHRIERLTMRRGVGNTLSLTWMIDAALLPNAKPDKELTQETSHRLAWDDVNVYLQAFAGRNAFAPANKPPQFTSLNNQEGYVGQPMSFSVAAQDPDGHAVRYLLAADIPGVSIDERSGRISLTPDKVGEIEIPLEVWDNGIPSEGTSRSLRVTVREPRPEAPPPAGPPAFDAARFTFLTGIVEVNGRREAWFVNRTQGENLHLREGETLKVGEFAAKVANIEFNQVTLITSDSQLLLRRGQSLSQAQVIGQR